MRDVMITVFEDAMWVKSVCMIKSWSKIWKRENKEIEESFLYKNLHQKDG